MLGPSIEKDLATLATVCRRALSVYSQQPPPVAAPAAIFSCTPGGLPSCGANIILNWSCTANLKATSGISRATLAPLPRYSA